MQFSYNHHLQLRGFGSAGKPQGIPIKRSYNEIIFFMFVGEAAHSAANQRFLCCAELIHLFPT